MTCDICVRAQTSALLCPTCSRSRLYQLRLNNASVLLERECLGQQIERAVSLNGGQERLTKETECQGVEQGNGSLEWTRQRSWDKQAQSVARMKVLAGQIENLRSCIKNKQHDIAQLRLGLARRRSDSESALYQLPERETGVLSGITNNIKRTDHLWHSNHIKTAEARIFLCREVASLYGLRQKVRKRDNGLKETYIIGGVSILDLRDLNGASPDQISTSFSYIAHMIVLVSHYLSLRLPAEITLPHRNYPSATIYTPSASYLSREPLSITCPDHSLSQSRTKICSNDTHALQPRPRLLCIDNSLPKLAKEDPGAYALFIEGATLLAWNVSWLCRSQGLNLGSDSWEDVCDVGKNLWQLLVAPPGQSSTVARALTVGDVSARMKTLKDASRTTIKRTKSFPMLGHYSHGTAHSFLGAAEGIDFVRNWKLPTPTKVVDRLKSTLLGEMASAEWELLEEKEWDDLPKEQKQPALLEAANSSDLTQNPRSSSIDSTVLASKEDGRDGFISAVRSKGTSGWTKLRNRQ